MSDIETRRKILIVDDNRQNIEMLKDLFKDEYKIAAAITPERALKLAAADPVPDIILLDIVMPGMTGYEVCEALKRDERTRDIPVIFVTAVSEAMDETKGFSVGAADYITKPFHPPMVQARVRVQMEMRRKQELLEKYAFIDALTDIPNRRRFDEQLEKEWNRALRSDLPLTLLFLDIDHFKEYNDTYGHGSGDRALHKVAQTIRASLRRAGDFVARYGGEEFAAILPYTGPEKGGTTAEQVMKDVRELKIKHKASPGGYLTISIGIATTTPHVSGVTMERLTEEADKSLYQAKEQGRDRMVAAEL